jgi:hypothetical protein
MINLEKTLIDEIRRRISAHHQLYDNLPVKAELWEHICHKVFGDEGWKPFNHSTNNDIRTNIEGMKVPSLKGGIIKDNILKFSSHRTTKHKSLEDKIKFLDSVEYDSFLFLARRDDGKIGEYVVCHMPSKTWKYSELEWSVNVNKKGFESGWSATSSDKKISLKIEKSMSHQLWIDVDMSLVTIITEIFI